MSPLVEPARWQPFGTGRIGAVLLSSGYSVDGQGQELLARGCHGFIQKPFEVEALSSKLRTLSQNQDHLENPSGGRRKWRHARSRHPDRKTRRWPGEVFYPRVTFDEKIGAMTEDVVWQA
jgi:DNA-binding NarL/FixJ family response regulator